MAKPKVHWLKKVRRVPDKLPAAKGAVGIRPVSFGMDKVIDKYIVSGGGHAAVITGYGKGSAMKIANARVRLMVKKAKLRARRR